LSSDREHYLSDDPGEKQGGQLSARCPITKVFLKTGIYSSHSHRPAFIADVLHGWVVSVFLLSRRSHVYAKILC
jgi:hypothetical protein